MSVDLSRFQDAFFEESGDHLATMEEGLLALEQRPQDLDLLNRIFRAAHSIKGNAGMFGFTTVGEFTHVMENLLDALRNGQMAASKPLIDLLLEGTDVLKGLIEGARTHSPADEAVVEPLLARLRTAAAGGMAGETEAGTAPRPAERPAAAGETTYAITWSPGATLFQRGVDPMQILRELRMLGTLSDLRVGADALPEWDRMDPEQCYLRWSLSLATRTARSEVDAVFDWVRDDSALEIVETAAVSTSAPAAPPSDHKPIGEILLEERVISPGTLRDALSQQKRLGEILVEQKAATPEQIASALEKQQKLDQAAQSRKTDTGSIRVDIGKIDKLVNLVGELVITQSMLSDLAGRFDMSQLTVLMERVAQLEANTREIQERVMGIRMLPIGTVFNRFPRLVRDLASRNGKRIQLVMTGEETELDKTVIESIGDPLTHLIRNAADHGLEPPEERQAHGKPEQGTLRLNAYHEGGSICIAVSDDGRGLSRDRILAKGVKQGLIAESDRLTDDQIWALIFQPGFSTADKITDVSGRGVGMDVVRRNIEALGGSVSIRTAAGQGTTFTLKLPLTLAIIEGMSVRVGRDIYIVPLVNIVESIQPKAEAVKTIVGRGEVVNVRGAYYPVVRLHEVFRIEATCTDPTQGILVIIETEGERVAVMVDDLVGQQQVVIKSLERNFRKVEGIAGATVLGDGTVGFIVDVRGLTELARHGELAAV